VWRPPDRDPEPDMDDDSNGLIPPGRFIKILIDPETSEAEVSLFQDGEKVKVFWGFGGRYEDADTKTPEGDHLIVARLGRIHTNIYRERLGHEFFLNSFIQLRGNYGIHAFKINDSTGLEEPGPTHGCIALSPEDSSFLYKWAQVGTPVSIRYEPFSKATGPQPPRSLQ